MLKTAPMTKSRRLAPSAVYKRPTKPQLKWNYTIIDALNDRLLFGPWFADKTLWGPWITFLKALFNIRMNPSETKMYEKFTKRQKPPTEEAREAWLVVGRRGGKSRIVALVAVYLACFYDWRPFLAPGERATVVVVAADRKQARVIMRYINAFFTDIPLLKPLLLREKQELFDLKGRITIEIHTASFRTVRGYTIIAALFDEVAFWRSDESNNPDTEVLAAIRPGMASVPGAKLLCASSPYAQRGILFTNWKEHFGKDDDDILVWQATTQDMNPTIDAEFLKAQYEADPDRASAEYGAQFRKDITGLVPAEVYEACEKKGRFELPPEAGNAYYAFVDPSGGGTDAFTLGIAHETKEGNRVLDLLREFVPPFSPEQVVADMCIDVKRYGCGQVVGDRYGGEWPREQFRKHDVAYAVAELPRSDLYREVLPLLNAKTAELLDNKVLKRQVLGLERRLGRSGKDIIDHPPGQHDDLANVMAGALVICGGGTSLEVW
jgi:hypothetical protein